MVPRLTRSRDGAGGDPPSTRGRIRRRRWAVAVLGLALAAGIAVFLTATRVFPHHSTNHDEAVYLQQAAMLLDGQLRLRPPVVEAFRPWFFVRDGGTLYPKYAPVPAAVFAAGVAAGVPRLSLAAVAAAVVALTGIVVAEAFDRRTGLAAAAFVLASPLFLIDASVFLPYAPTAALELLFAAAYLRADRTGSLRWAGVAGAGIGIAFFARPYTAVLFATPFVAHALWTLRSAVAARTVRSAVGVRALAAPVRHPTVRRIAVTAALGLGGVALALAYNAVLTGSPTRFPYEAFAPRDGLGFGRRSIAGYERGYTPGLALRSNAVAVRRFAVEWVAAGPVGAGLALAGGGRFVVRAIRGRVRPPVRGRQAVLLGVAASVVVGNLYFWGTLNTLGALDDPTDGLIRTLGPYYHFDLLLPAAAFAGHALVSGGDRVRRAIRSRFSAGRGRALAAAALIVTASVLGGAAVAAADRPIDENRAVADRLDAAYAPIDGRSFGQALVFLPTPYDDWLHHPFQRLRNAPGYDGPVVYAIDERPFAVVDAFPDRRLYRYAYRGDWAPVTGEPVDARLQRLRHVAGDRIVMNATLGVPAGTTGATVGLAGGGDRTYYTVRRTRTDGRGPGQVPLRLRLDGGRARLRGPVDPVGNASGVPVPGRGSIGVVVFVQRGRYGFSYRLELPVDRSAGDGRVRALTPRIEVCDAPRRCGGEAAYVPRTADEDVSATVTLGTG